MEIKRTSYYEKPSERTAPSSAQVGQTRHSPGWAAGSSVNAVNGRRP